MDTDIFMKSATRAVRVLLQSLNVTMGYTSYLLDFCTMERETPITEVQLARLVLELDLNATRREIKYLQAKARIERYALARVKSDLAKEKRNRRRYAKKA